MNIFGGGDDEKDVDETRKKAQKFADKDDRKQEHAIFGGKLWLIRENWKTIIVGLTAFLLIAILVYLQAMIPAFFILVFILTAPINYYAAKSLQSVPSTAVIETDNKNRKENLYIIPDTKLPEFDISGNPTFFKDQFGTDILHADDIDWENMKIKCAWSHEVSNYNFSVMQEAFDQAKKIAQENIKENARYKYNTREMALQYANTLLGEALTGPLEEINKEEGDMRGISKGGEKVDALQDDEVRKLLKEEGLLDGSEK